MSAEFATIMDKLRYSLRDYTAVGVKNGAFAFVTDEQIYKFSPERYSFYMQLLDALSDPKSDLLDKVLGIEARSRLSREKMKEKMTGIAKALKYLDLRLRRPQTGGDGASDESLGDTLDTIKKTLDDEDASIKNEVSDLTATSNTIINPQPQVTSGKDQNVAATEDPQVTSGKDQNVAATEDPQVTSGKDQNVAAPGSEPGAPAPEAAAVDSTAAKETVAKRINKAITGNILLEGYQLTTGGSYFSDKLQQLQTAKNTKEVEDVIDEVDTHPIYSEQFEKVSVTDRIIFIAVTFVIRGLVLFLVDWGIHSHMIGTFQRAFIIYMFAYVCIFVIWAMLVNAGEDGDNLFFRMMFYYVNWHNNGFGRIIAHLAVQLFLLPIPFIVKERNLGSTGKPVLSYEERRAMYRTLSNFTFFIWILTSIIALRY
jgi:hypothetical protein